MGDFINSLIGATATKEISQIGGNLQTMELPRPAMNIDPSIGRGGGDIIVDESALVPEEGPAGAGADIIKPKNSTISIYVVRAGDTLSAIAKMFDVSSNTILWGNDLSRSSKLKVGQTLTILPVTGVEHKVAKGDTLSSIAKKYGADAQEIARYNGLDEGALALGSEIIIPDGELSIPVSSGVGRTPSYATPSGTPSQVGYYLRPIAGGTRTQGIHGYNSVDLAAPIGTPILASAEGDVIVAKSTGWNGGYGGYVVVQHPNGSQTLYSHASSVIVSLGQHVQQGQVIAYVG
ncbi:MAG: M23 family metallopeptidase, partial [Patescibacteria group bacterium]